MSRNIWLDEYTVTYADIVAGPQFNTLEEAAIHEAIRQHESVFGKGSVIRAQSVYQVNSHKLRVRLVTRPEAS